jgi:hypothetical protein
MFEFRTMDVQHHQRKSVGPDKRLATLEGERCTCNTARRNSNHQRMAALRESARLRE